jgi:2-methylcitrate dehydratase PrpD
MGVARSQSETLCLWLAGLDPARLPAGVRDAAIDTLIDVAGLAVAARHTDYMEAVRAAFAGDGPCTALGHGRGWDAASAAMINGTAAHGEDFDNTFEGCPVHTGAVVVPAVLAAAECYGINGERTLAGIAAGIEVMCRLGLVSGTHIHSAGFHPTAVLGTFAAAAGVGVALALPAGALVNALGISGSMASGIIEYLADGTWTKRMHAGWAAQSGLRAALMGQHGFSGPRTVFEGEHGFFSGFASPLDPDFGPLTDALGERWQAERLAFKPFACGTMTQPYIDCAIELKGLGIAADDIAGITCEVGERTVHRLWEPLASKQRPATPYGAKFSTPYCVAVGFLDGDAGLAQFTEARIGDEAVLGLAAKVRYRVDPDNEYPSNYTGHLKVALKDGTVHEIRRPHLRGGARQPLSRADLVRKFTRNAVFGGWTEDEAGRLASFCEALGGVADLSGLADFRR